CFHDSHVFHLDPEMGQVSAPRRLASGLTLVEREVHGWIVHLELGVPLADLGRRDAEKGLVERAALRKISDLEGNVNAGWGVEGTDCFHGDSLRVCARLSAEPLHPFKTQ